MKAAARHGEGGGDPGDRHRSGGKPAGGGLVAELAFDVASPASQRAVAKARARVEAAAGDRRDIADATNRHRCGRIGLGPVAELAVVIQPPAVHGGVLQDGAGVVGPGVQGSGRADSGGRELLGLADRDGGISRSDEDFLRRDVPSDQSEREARNTEHEERFRLSHHLRPLATLQTVRYAPRRYQSAAAARCPPGEALER